MSNRIVAALLAMTVSSAAAPVAADSPLPESDEELDGDLQLQPTQPLRLYGFSDFTFRRIFLRPDSVLQTRLDRHSSFAVGKLNLYLRSNPAPKWSSLVEFRLLYLPNGSLDYDGLNRYQRVDTRVYDGSDIGGMVEWGGISIRRAWIQYDWHKLLSVRLGHWITPYGLWNIDHGSPTLVDSRRPIIVGQQLFPESQSGIQLRGGFEYQRQRISYAATISNGRSIGDKVADHDPTKAVGGRIELANEWFDEFKIGASFYSGRKVHTELLLGASDPNDPTTAFAREVVLEATRELSLAADLRIRHKNMRLDAEIVSLQSAFTDRGRTRHFAEPNAAAGTVPADFHRWGFYLLGGYRTDWHNAMPFASVEGYRDNATNIFLSAFSGGINLRPVPTIALKLSYTYVRFSAHGGPPQYPLDPIRSVQTQVAWVFR